MEEEPGRHVARRLRVALDHATAESRDLLERSGDEKVARRMLYLLGLLGALEEFRGTMVEGMASAAPTPNSAANTSAHG